jgi:Ala-tRNA(Pro) deacylase
MGIARQLQAYLESKAVDYELIAHPHTESSMVTAAAAHVPGDRLAKAVIVKDGDDYWMVVVPSDYHVRLGALHKRLGREVGLATEPEVAILFPDCDEGAAPAVGAAYGVRAMVDERLLGEPEVFFEAGDHEHLVRVSGDRFQALQAEAERVDVAQHI